MTASDLDPDVLVAGGGIAGLCAAIAARRAGARVLMVEAAPRALRGGNARHARNLRLMHAGPTELMPGAYDEAEFLADLTRVTAGEMDHAIAARLIQASAGIPDWLAGCGVGFQRPGGSLPPSRKTAYFLGGGKAVVNALHAEAARLGVAVWHQAELVDLDAAGGLAAEVRRNDRMDLSGVGTAGSVAPAPSPGGFAGAQPPTPDQVGGRLSPRRGEVKASPTGASSSPLPGGERSRAKRAGEGDTRADQTGTVFVRPRALVAAAGGHQADLDWLRRDFGPAAERFAIRGTPFDTGAVLRLLLEAGARPAGAPGRGHLVAVDARGPKFDGGIVTRVEAIPFGLVVDRAGQRLGDEAADPARTHFAAWGRLLAERGNAVLLLDADGEARAPVPALEPVRAATLDELAAKVGVDAGALAAAVEAFNARGGARVARPPFAAIPMCPGLTFTHFGVEVDEAMRVRMTGGGASGLFAAGAIMAALVLGRGYLAGLGLTIAVASGRIAGEEAARQAREFRSAEQEIAGRSGRSEAETRNP